MPRHTHGKSKYISCPKQRFPSETDAKEFAENINEGRRGTRLATQVKTVEYCFHCLGYHVI